MGVTTVTLLCVTVLAVSFVTATEQLKVSYSIDEELQTNIVVGNVIMDAALGSKYERHVLAQLRFRLLPGKYNQYFSVNVSSGTLHTRETIDRETVCPRASVCRLLLDLAIVKPVELFQIIKISVTVVDKNDNAPQFPQQDVEFAVSENALPGMTFIIPNAEDLDSGIFSIQRYELSEQVANFDLQVTNGSAGVDLRLVLTGRLDRERQTSYGMTLVAYDGGMPARSGSLDIKITVLDANDNSPKFDRLLYEVTVAEDTRPLTTIIKVHATDPDQGLNGQIVYSFTHPTQQSFGDTFAIGNATGEISIKKHLDYEAEKFYQLLVTGTDLGASSIPVHVKVMVYVEDVNDHPPVISINALSATGRTELYENAANGTFVAHVSVEDPDAHTNISCTVHSRYFTLLKLYPREYKIVTRSSFDREKRDKYTVTVECSDNGEPPLSSTQEVSVTILDRNDNAPLFAHSSYVVNVKENGTVGVALLVAQARDTDSGSNADVIYTLAGEASNLLTVGPKTGVLKTNAVYDHELMVKFVCDVIATDQGSPSKSAITTITVNIVDVNDEAPIFSRAEYTFGTFENQPARTDIGSVLAMDADSAPYDEIVFSLQNTDGSTGAFQIDRRTGKISTTIVLDREKQSSHHMVVVATNVSPPRLSSSAQVIVYVADRNDNAPRIEFPNEENMTVQVSLYAPVGYTFCRILASDADLGENARLFYAITAGNKHSLFAMNPHTGDISVGDDLGSTSTDVHKLLVVVRDNGADPKSAIATLTIVVNQSAVFDNFHFDMSSPVYAANSGPAIQLGYHERIMVILAVVTAVIVVILVTAIVLIKRRQTRFAKDAYQYTCQGDLYSTNSEVDRSTSYSDQEPHKSVNVSHLRDGDVTTMTEPADTQKQDVLTCSDVVKAGYPVKTDHITLKDLQALGEGSPVGLRLHCCNAIVMHSRQSPPAHSPFLPPQLKNRKQVEVHQLLELLARDPDVDSASGCSAEVSNTDSGHGPSEEGDQRHSVTTFTDAPPQHYRTFDAVRNSFKSTPTPTHPPRYCNVTSRPCVMVDQCPADNTDHSRPFSDHVCNPVRCSSRPGVSNSHGQNCTCGSEHHMAPNHEHLNGSPYSNAVKTPTARSVQFRGYDVTNSENHMRTDDTDTNFTDDDSSSSTSGSYTVGVEGDDVLSTSVDV